MSLIASARSLGRAAALRLCAAGGSSYAAVPKGGVRGGTSVGGGVVAAGLSVGLLAGASTTTAFAAKGTMMRDAKIYDMMRVPSYAQDEAARKRRADDHAAAQAAKKARKKLDDFELARTEDGKGNVFLEGILRSGPKFLKELMLQKTRDAREEETMLKRALPAVIIPEPMDARAAGPSCPRSRRSPGRR